ncbi:MAG: hypothetical protein UW73_C0019G0016 [Microgenomates group bacterium GW2011_GWB1_44_8]|nr:MAG: hypothetical protein UW73_C0019G0016 [Microgenomates group bacterium GW2011_GWB1_44_8]
MSSKALLIGIVLSFALLFGAAFWFSQPQPTAPVVASASTGQLTTTQTFYDFGTISMKKGPVSYKFTVTNSDSIPATVTKLYSSCMCTKGALITPAKTWGPFGMPGHVAIPKIAAEIAPGQTAQIEVIFDPAAHGPAGVGRIERTVTAELNGQAPLLFSFRANVTP